MPKKLIYPKEAQIASIKLEWIQFQVIAKMDQINIGNVIYYQVQRKRKKIANYKDKETAIRRMFVEADYEQQSFFSIKVINEYNQFLQKENNNISPAYEIWASQYKAPN